MRRALFVVGVLCLTTAAVSAQSPGENVSSAMYITTVYVASPMRTHDEAVSAAGRHGAVIATNDTETPYLVVSGAEIIVCVAAGSRDQVKSAADAYVRDLNRGRPYIVEAFADRLAAQLLMERIRNTTYSFFGDAWIADASNGGAFLLYRNTAR